MTEVGPAKQPRKIPLEQPLYDRVDPQFFTRVVDRFYDSVLADPVLAPLYPTDDLEGARDRLRLFLEQFWGGPQTYSEQRGHPRLRMRHEPFVIGETERDAWFRAMSLAVNSEVEAGNLSDQDEAAMLGYFAHSARFMMNKEE
ncbi:MAG: globin [Acidimicrobiales bacterium]